MKCKQKKGFYSYKQLKNFANSIVLREEISKDVKKEFKTIKDLIVCSAKNPNFLGVAYDRCFLIFEMALKKRFEEIEKKKTQQSLLQLITWADKNQFFEEEVDQVRKINKLRRKSAHPEQWNLLGAIPFYGIQFIKNMINGLYEDIKLRKARKLEYERFDKLFKQFNKKGAILEMKDSKLIIFHSQLLGIENRITPSVYNFLFLPIFDLTIRKDKSVNNPRQIIFKIEKYSRKLNKLQFSTSSNYKEVSLSMITNSRDKEKFQNWKKKFTEHEFSLVNLIYYQTTQLKNYIRNEIFSNFL